MQDSQLKAKQELEYIHCYLCRKDTSETIITSRRSIPTSVPLEASDTNRNGVFRLVKCKNCGLHYLNPRPIKQQIGYYYLEDYDAHVPLKRKKPKERDLLAGKLIDLKKSMRELVRINYFNYPCNPEEDGKSLTPYKKVLLWFYYHLDYRSRLNTIPYSGEGKILDIGCGNGRYLTTMKNQGWQTFGVEINPKASKYAREELRLDVSTGDVLDCRYQDKFFDVITMRHSLEHLYEPVRTLKEVKRILKDDGLLVIEVPNIDSFAAKVFKEYWYQLEIPIHLIAFTPDSITKMLGSVEFKTKNIYYDRRHSPLRHSLHNLNGGKYKLLSKLSRFKLLIKMLNSVLAMSGKGEIIVVHAQKNTLQYNSKVTN